MSAYSLSFLQQLPLLLQLDVVDSVINISDKLLKYLTNALWWKIFV